MKTWLKNKSGLNFTGKLAYILLGFVLSISFNAHATDSVKTTGFIKDTLYSASLQPKKDNVIDDINLEEIKEAIIDKAEDKSPRKKVASLSFSWGETVGMAAFFREEYMWIVFDQRQTLNIEEMEKMVSGLAHDIVQIPHSKGTLLRLTLNHGTRTAIRKEGHLWILDMFNQEFPHKINEMEIRTQNNSVNEPYLFIPSSTSSNIISFIDPEIGDSIITIPNTEVRHGLQNPYSYPDLEFLSSIQGLAVAPISSDLIFSKGNTGITIKASNRGLYISPNLELLKKREKDFETTDEISSLEAQIPYHLFDKTFSEVMKSFQDQLAEAAPEEINAIKLQLARYHLGMGMGSEALTLLNEIEASKDQVTELEFFHALKGIANFLLKRYDTALEEFSYRNLPTVNEAIFWRTLISSAIEFKKEDNIVLQSFMTVVKNYPKRIKEKVAIQGAFNAIGSFDDMTTQNFIDIIKSVQNGDENQTIIDYLQAEKLAIQGYPLNALKEYKKAAQGKDQKYASYARKKVADLEHRLGLSSIDKTIAELEKLKYAWGEQEFKLNILETLADLYLQNNDPYNALKSLQTALTLADSQHAKHLTSQMVTIFEDIYVHNQSDSLPPLKSLAMYDDFDWLAPLSENYNEIVQKIADRLVAVDLLKRASDMLYKLLKKKDLSENERAAVGARIALIYLFKNASSEAIEILDNTEGLEVSKTISAQRRIIRAKALSNLEHNIEALELLKNDTSRNAFILKSELYWNAGLWQEASENLKYLVEEPTSGKELSKEQISLILDWITSLKKAGKETVVARARNKFLPYFENTPYLSTFNVLTNALDKEEVDIKYISKAVEDIKAYSNFSKIYNDALRNN